MTRLRGNRRWAASGWIVGAVVLMLPPAAQAQLVTPAPFNPQSEEAAVVDSATNVLNEIMAAPAQGIPRALLHDAQGIAVVPSLLKGGFVIGIRHGRGIVVTRDENGNWRLPSFITITGGSIGWQAGIQATDVVLVFKTKTSVQGLLNGKFTIGADVSAAAGPVGREASAATDATLRAEIYSYSRSRGLFAGAALDGSAITLDNAATAVYYRGTGVLQGDGPPGQAPVVPPSAVRFLETVALYSRLAPAPGQPVEAAAMVPVPTAPVVPGGVAAAPGGTVPMPSPPEPNAALPADLQAIRPRLADASRRMSKLLDQRWQQYLALPAEVYDANRAADPAAMAGALSRYSAVSADPRYATLARRPEFQETLGLLRAYCDVQSAVIPSLALPPPPR